MYLPRFHVGLCFRSESDRDVFFPAGSLVLNDAFVSLTNRTAFALLTSSIMAGANLNFLYAAFSLGNQFNLNHGCST